MLQSKQNKVTFYHDKSKKKKSSNATRIEFSESVKWVMSDDLGLEYICLSIYICIDGYICSVTLSYLWR